MKHSKFAIYVWHSMPGEASLMRTLNIKIVTCYSSLRKLKAFPGYHIHATPGIEKQN